jgi:hypothetical protein
LPRFVFAVACLAAAACKREPPAQPRFCEQDLSGVWLNSSDRSFAYSFRDVGGVVSGEYMQRAEDGGLTRPAEPVTFELKRTDTAIAGVMRSSGTTPSGKTCAVEFETRISDCKPEALQVVSEVSAPIGDDCKRHLAEDGGAIPPDFREFRFERDRP